MKKPKTTVELRVAFTIPEGWTKRQARNWARAALIHSATWRATDCNRAALAKSVKIQFV